MKRLLATLLMFVLLCAPTAAVLAFGKPDVVKHTIASIVRVEFPLEENGPGICTGFMVEYHHALTAAHCVPEDAGFTVDGADSFVIKRGAQLVLVYAGEKPVLKLAKRFALRDEVISFGYAWGDMFVFNRRIAALKDQDFAMDGPLAPGQSGGPTVNQAGEVVGLNQGANAVIGILCGAQEIRAFLTR